MKRMIAPVIPQPVLVKVNKLESSQYDNFYDLTKGKKGKYTGYSCVNSDKTAVCLSFLIDGVVAPHIGSAGLCVGKITLFNEDNFNATCLIEIIGSQVFINKKEYTGIYILSNYMEYFLLEVNNITSTDSIITLLTAEEATHALIEFTYQTRADI